MSRTFVREYPVLFAHCDPAGIELYEQGGDAPLQIPQVSGGIATP